MERRFHAKDFVKLNAIFILKKLNFQSGLRILLFAHVAVHKTPLAQTAKQRSEANKSSFHPTSLTKSKSSAHGRSPLLLMRMWARSLTTLWHVHASTDKRNFINLPAQYEVHPYHKHNNGPVGYRS